MIVKILAELVGTFFFLSVILATGEAVPIGIALAAAIFMTAKMSGGHLNPAVSTMMFAKGNIDASTYIAYVIAQIIGGLLALFFFSMGGSN
uniref:Major intrinsic protein n=1 Tax=viral metagenome TaxID=1070528 RepID=A0A6C0BGY2_9ZZZZ